MVEKNICKVVTANDLLEGDVIFLNRAGGWTRNLLYAAIATTDEGADRLMEQANQPLTVVGPYLINVELDPDGRPMPEKFREALRNAGPSNRFDLNRTRAPHQLSQQGI